MDFFVDLLFFFLIIVIILNGIAYIAFFVLVGEIRKIRKLVASIEDWIWEE